MLEPVDCLTKSTVLSLFNSKPNPNDIFVDKMLQPNSDAVGNIKLFNCATFMKSDIQ